MNTVTLYPTHRLDLHARDTLKVVGSGSNAVRGVTGVPLLSAGVGRPGSDFATTVDASNLIVANPSSPVGKAAAQFAQRVRHQDLHKPHFKK